MRGLRESLKKGTARTEQRTARRKIILKLLMNKAETGSLMKCEIIHHPC